MKKLFLFFLLLAASALFAQNVRKDDVVFTRIGSPAPGASIAVCTQPCTVPAAVSLSNLPSPLAAICSSSSDAVCIQTNPVTADGLGNYSFYIAPGKYTLVFFGSGLTQRTQTDQILACDPTNCIDFSFNTASTGNVFKINGTTISTVTGAGAVVLATSPTISGATLSGNTAFSGTTFTFPPPFGMTSKKGTGVGNYSTVSAAYVDIDGTNLAFAVTVPSGWKADVKFTAAFAMSASNGNFAITDGTTVLIEALSIGNTTTQSITLETIFTGDGSSHTFKARYLANGGATNTVQNSSATNVPVLAITLMPSN